MTDVPESERGIRYLSGSPTRVAVLEQVCDGTTRPAALVDAIAVSRTTVHRTLTDLVERNWVERVDGGYAATAVGALALEAYRNARTQFRTLERVEPFLARVDANVDDLEIEWFRTAELSTVAESNPHQPLEWYADRLETVDGERLRGVSPVISRQFIAVHAPIVERGTPTELVIGESTYRVVAERYADELRTSVSRSNYALYVAEETPPIGITLVGSTVFLGAYDDGGQLVAAVESADDRLRAWAADRHRERRDDARRITADAVP
ncbi:helix-turn-helix transcriptional regulator [Natronococcus wangiae]|uniref:helix-turn-helix transcriptional regulator n=1 Tax=Natronococcus wangiae TaxID=3068275 RepID=UPI00273FF416|nr:helix-turn-helix domain-containing protein [Natronococcus sp. AD5]